MAPRTDSTRRSVRVIAEGHLIDTGLLSRFFGVIIEAGGSYEIVRFDVGRTKRDFSSVELDVVAASAAARARIVDNLNQLGARLKDEREVELRAVAKNGVAPDGFYATTHHRTKVRHGGRTIDVADQRMDAMIVVDGRRARCVLMRDLKRGDRVVCGVTGVEATPPFETRRADAFSFMRSVSSSERAVEVKAREIAAMIRRVRAGGKKVVAVPGPVVIHTGGAKSFARLIDRGWVDVVLSGNALAVHDVELAMFGTSLGIDIAKGVAAREGHMNHLRAINAVRAAGSIAKAVENGTIRSGIFRACVANRVPFVLAGSIRDDGPLPDTEMDLVAAQREYARHLKDAGMILILASMLHGIGVGNMTPSEVVLVCVDIHQGVVTKLADRGSAQAIGVVTDVSAFLHRLDAELKSKGGARRRGGRR